MKLVLVAAGVLLAAAAAAAARAVRDAAQLMLAGDLEVD